MTSVDFSGACSQSRGQSPVNFNSVGVDFVTVASISYIGWKQEGKVTLRQLELHGKVKGKTATAGGYRRPVKPHAPDARTRVLIGRLW